MSGIRILLLYAEVLASDGAVGFEHRDMIIGYGCHILMGTVVRNMAKIELLTRMESLSMME